MITAEVSVTDHVQSFQEGNERAFNIIFREYYAALAMFGFRITRRMEVAEEIAADALFKLWERHEGFSHPLSIRSFLYKAVRFACLNFMRDHQRESSRLIDLTYISEQVEYPVLRGMIIRESFKEAKTAMKTLPLGCRKVADALFVDEKKPQRVAMELSLSVSTVRNQKARALQLLRSRMDLGSCNLY